MLTIIEGVRNVGKTYLLAQTNTKIYKFDFPHWFNVLNLKEDKAAHLFAIGKEILLHNLSCEKFIDNIVVDRGILTVLVWGIVERRITRKTAVKQLGEFADKGLFDNTRIIYIEGKNPKERINRDKWNNVTSEIERGVYAYLISELEGLNTPCEIIRYKNNFDDKSMIDFNKII